MRQAGTLSNERAAQQFAAWLVTQRIEAHAEREGDEWAVWVRDEDRLREAREALAHFRDHPQDAKYVNAEQAAAALVREDETRRQQSQRNVVEMRGRWGTPGMPGGGAPRRCPVVLLTIAATILVVVLTFDDTMSTQDGPQPSWSAAYRALVFVDPHAAVTRQGALDVWASVSRGQLWRLLTPALIHYGWAHLILNMLWLYSFGSRIEDRRGSVFMVLLVLVLAAASTTGQAAEAAIRQQGILFGGMSGVGYGLFGYIFTKNRYDARERYFLAPGTAFLAILWLVLCIAREVPPFDELLAGAIPPIANSAHVAGLITGAAIAYAPLVMRRAL